MKKFLITVSVALTLPLAFISVGSARASVEHGKDGGHVVELRDKADAAKKFDDLELGDKADAAKKFDDLELGDKADAGKKFEDLELGDKADAGKKFEDLELGDKAADAGKKFVELCDHELSNKDGGK